MTRRAIGVIGKPGRYERTDPPESEDEQDVA
jgi:hypothetical protein